jgi:ligand-binding SRPBCC domain-containing protein
MKIQLKTPIQKNFRQVFSYFNLELFKALRPPGANLIVERFDGCKKGDQVHLKIAGMPWVSHIVDFFEDEDCISFTDLGVIIPPPLKYWRHVHKIERTKEDACLIIDEIDYSTGNIFTDKLLYPFLYAVFAMRKPIYKRELS